MTSVACTSSIQRVLVYSRGAAVTRRIRLPATLPPEPCEVVISGLTPQLEAGSLRAELVGGRDVVSLRSRLVLPEATRDPEEAREKLRELELDALRLESEQRLVQDRRTKLSGVEPSLRLSRKEADPGARAQDALAANGLVADLLAGLDARLRDVAEARRKLDKQRTALHLLANQGGPQDVAEPRSEVVVKLGSGSPSVASLELTYVVRAARWWPAYSARLSDGGTKAEWTLEAFVAQATGEDWTEVKLGLSTADLVTDARLPELSSLRLGRSQPKVNKGFRPPPEGLDALFGAYDEAKAGAVAPEPSPEPISTPSVQVNYANKADDLEYGASLGDEVMRRHRPEGAPEPKKVAPDYAPTGGKSGGKRRKSASMTRAGGYAPPPPSPAREMKMAAAPSRGGGMNPLAAVAGAAGGMAEAAAGLFAGDGDDGQAFGSWQSDAIEPADAWLDFDALVMGANEDLSGRGRLTRASQPGAAGVLREARLLIDRIRRPYLTREPVDDRGWFDHSYAADGWVDVPNLPQAHRVTLRAATATCTSRLRAVPREEDAVYREVELLNPLESPLLGGPVDVFFDGALLTTSSIVPVGRGGKVLLGLGVEDRVRVARNARVEETTQGLLGGTAAITHRITIDLTSSLGAPVDVLVVDRVPVVDDDEDDLEVELIESAPKAEPYEQRDRDAKVKGGLKWLVSLSPGGKRSLTFSYRVTLPAKREVVGGNRRD